MKFEQVFECYSKIMLVMILSKILMRFFWRNVHDSQCSRLSDDIKEAYDLSNLTKVPIKRRGALTTSNVIFFMVDLVLR